MSLARRNYQRIWKQDRKFLGARGMPAPLVRLNTPTPGAMAVTGGEYGDVRRIELSPGTTRLLKRYDSAKQKPSQKAWARYIVEHELARVYQPDSVFTAASANKGSGVANALSNRLAHARNLRGKQRRVAGRRLRRYARKQFPYYGQNPRTIHVPDPPAPE